MALGHLFVQREFGTQFVPRLSWQIDPFGASAAVAWLFSSFFDFHVVDRVDFALKSKWIAARALEFTWSEGIFTHCLEEHYSSPQGFDFEGSFEDNPQISRRNLAARAEALLAVVRRRASYFRTDNLLLLFGDDFRFVNANSSHSGVRLQYALAADYFEAVAPLQPQWPQLEGGTDLFPYRKDSAFQWYTGYYTTRPAQKAAISALFASARAAAMLVAGAGSAADGETRGLLLAVQQSCARMLHHDTITGTSSNATVRAVAAELAIAAAKVRGET